MTLLRDIANFIGEYGGGLAFILTWLGIGWLYFRQRAAWSRKEFATQVNFSLNYIMDDQLVMRTLLETSAQEVWLSELGVRKVQKALARTTEENPFLSVPDPTDMDFLNRAVLNVLSEKFAEVYLAQSLGLPVTTETYLFALTFERYKPQRTFKLRILIVTEKDLEAITRTNAQGEEHLRTSSAIYASRIRTLRKMKELLDLEAQPGTLKFGRVVLGLVTH